jgi:hypothetical protein
MSQTTEESGVLGPVPVIGRSLVVMAPGNDLITEHRVFARSQGSCGEPQR